MKKVLSLVLVLAMVLGSFSFVSAAEFTDVTGTEFVSAVERLDLLGILEGYPDGTFKPEGAITRAEFAAVAVRAKGLKEVALAAQGLPTGFTDVPTTHWASGYVGTASRLSIVNGIGWGQFAPASPVKYEEAVTMMVRALGYEVAAQAKGGYPYGYLIIASEIDLLDDVKGTQGVAATRGLVAQLTDNALEIAMMIQVGYGTETKWVKSGEDDTDKLTLLDQMGFEAVEGRVTKVDADDLEITVDGEILDVAEGFDFYAVEGVEIKAWVDNDKVVAFTIEEDVQFDAVEVDDDEITLIGDEENYEVAKDAKITVDGEKVAADKFDANYAKVVLNDDDEIIWAEGFMFDGFIVVDEIDDEVVTSLNDDELDVEDFLLVKEGKTIAIADLEEGDVVFYNDGEEFAVVYNMSETGEIERVYTNSFKFGGDTYDNSTDLGNVLYLDEDVMDDIDADILDGMMDEEEEVAVFFDFEGNAVLVVGNSGVAKTNDSYAILTKGSVAYDGRKGAMLALDVMNAAGEKASYDLDAEFVLTDKDILGLNWTDINAEVTETAKMDEVASQLTVSKLLEITIDEDGDVTEVALLPTLPLAVAGFETDDTYAKDSLAVAYKLQSSSVIFYDYDDVNSDYEEVVTLADSEGIFSEVEEGSMYVKDGKVEVVLAIATDADTDSTSVTGLVTNVRKLKSGAYEFTMEVAGVKEVYVTDSEKLTTAQIDAVTENYVDEIVKVMVGDTSGKMVLFDISDTTTADNQIAKVIAGEAFTVKSINTTNKTITTTSVVYDVYEVFELTSKAVVYDGTDDFETLSLRDLSVNDTIRVYTDGGSARFVSYVVKTNVTPGSGSATSTFELAFVARENTWVTIEGTDYLYGGSLTVSDLNTAFANQEVAFTTKIIDGEVVVITITK